MKHSYSSKSDMRPPNIPLRSALFRYKAVGSLQSHHTAMIKHSLRRLDASRETVITFTLDLRNFAQFFSRNQKKRSNLYIYIERRSLGNTKQGPSRSYSIYVYFSISQIFSLYVKKKMGSVSFSSCYQASVRLG